MVRQLKCIWTEGVVKESVVWHVQETATYKSPAVHTNRHAGELRLKSRVCRANQGNSRHVRRTTTMQCTTKASVCVPLCFCELIQVEVTHLRQHQHDEHR